VSAVVFLGGLGWLTYVYVQSENRCKRIAQNRH